MVKNYVNLILCRSDSHNVCFACIIITGCGLDQNLQSCVSVHFESQQEQTEGEACSSSHLHMRKNKSRPHLLYIYWKKNILCNAVKHLLSSLYPDLMMTEILTVRQA